MSHHSANWGKNGKLQGCQRTKRKSLKEIRKGNCPLPPRKLEEQLLKRELVAKGTTRKLNMGMSEHLFTVAFTHPLVSRIYR